MVASSLTRSPTLSSVFFLPVQSPARSSHERSEDAYIWERKEHTEFRHSFCTDMSASVSGPLSRFSRTPGGSSAGINHGFRRLPPYMALLRGASDSAQAARLLA